MNNNQRFDLLICRAALAALKFGLGLIIGFIIFLLMVCKGSTGSRKTEGCNTCLTVDRSCTIDDRGSNL